jgi:hypothetical protein
MKIISGSRRCHYLVNISILLFTVALIAEMPGSYGVGGNDTYPSENLEIRDWYDLDAVRNNLAGHHTLMIDLDSTTPGYEGAGKPNSQWGKRLAANWISFTNILCLWSRCGSVGGRLDGYIRRARIRDT